LKVLDNQILLGILECLS